MLAARAFWGHCRSRAPLGSISTSVAKLSAYHADFHASSASDDHTSVRSDVIVVGAGHNGLVAAALLAKSGLNVHVVEVSEQLPATEIALKSPQYGCCKLAETQCNFCDYQKGTLLGPGRRPWTLWVEPAEQNSRSPAPQISASLLGLICWDSSRRSFCRWLSCA